MNVKNDGSLLIFDGDIQEMQKISPEVEFEGVKTSVTPDRLVKIEDLPKVVNGVDLDSVVRKLGFKVTVFDGDKIYHGSKNGLKLFFVSNVFNGVDKFLILSFGEFQPGRFICKFEGVLEA